LFLSDLIEKRAGIGSNLIPPKYLWSSYGSANLYESGLAFLNIFWTFAIWDAMREYWKSVAA